MGTQWFVGQGGVSARVGKLVDVSARRLGNGNVLAMAILAMARDRPEQLQLADQPRLSVPRLQSVCQLGRTRMRSPLLCSVSTVFASIDSPLYSSLLPLCPNLLDCATLSSCECKAHQIVQHSHIFFVLVKQLQKSFFLH